MKGMRLIDCNCTGQAAEYQAAKYGKGKRLANESDIKTKRTAKCTCCGKIDTKAAGSGEPSKG